MKMSRETGILVLMLSLESCLSVVPPGNSSGGPGCDQAGSAVVR